MFFEAFTFVFRKTFFSFSSDFRSEVFTVFKVYTYVLSKIVFNASGLNIFTDQFSENVKK